MTCINCQTDSTGKFCPNCGQKVDVKRITFKEGWHDFWARIYGFDGMFPRTLKDLTLRPGFAAREYIKGNRMKYYGPVGYFFLMITLWLLTMSLLNVDVNQYFEANRKTMSDADVGEGQQKFFLIMATFFNDNVKWIALFSLLIDSLAARFLFYRKSGLNFLEHAVLIFFMRGHIYWVSIASVLLFKLTGSVMLNSAIVFGSVFFFGFGYTSFMDDQPKGKSFLKGMGVYVVGQMIVFLVFGIALITLLWLSPEFYEMIKPSNNR